MEESGESSTEALGDRGSCSMHRRIRGKQTHHEDGQDIHSLSDERASEAILHPSHIPLLQLSIGQLEPVLGRFFIC